MDDFCVFMFPAKFQLGYYCHCVMADKKGTASVDTTTDNTATPLKNQPEKRPLESPGHTGESPPVSKLKSQLTVEDFLDMLCDSKVIAVLEGIMENVVAKALKIQMESMTKRVEVLEQKVDCSKVSISDHTNKITAADVKVASLEKKVVELSETLEKTSKEVGELQYLHDDLEQYGRRLNLRVSGLKATNEPGTPEDTDKAIIHLCRDQLGVQIQLSDIQRSHRVGPKEASNRAIIFRFVSYRVRTSVLKARSKLKNTGIFVNEDLTKRRNRLAYLARQLKKNNKIVDTWTYDGKVFVKYRASPNNPALKTTEIRHEVDFDNIP